MMESAPLRNKIKVALRQAIERGVFKPGDRLIEKDLCAQLNVSRTSLREALRELEAHKVITNSSLRGLVVTSITEADAENVYRIRAELEALTAQQFIERLTEPNLANLKLAAEGLQTAYSSQDIDRILEAKRIYYDQFCRGANNPIVFELLETLQLRTSHLRSASMSRPSRQTDSIGEIAEVVRCIESRNIPGARAAARKHVEGAMISALGKVRSP